jgi:arabinofuranosyltransferase
MAPETAYGLEREDREYWLAFFLSLGAAFVAFWVFRGLRHDDAYITMQYARNVGSGRGFVFNPGERVLGATSPLHVLLLAGIYALLGDVLAPTAVLISALAIGAQAFLLFLVFRPVNRVLGWLIGALVVLGLMGSYSYVALETNLMGALVLGVTVALEKRRETLCGVLLGLAFLCRYDAGLLIPIAVVIWRMREGIIPKRLLLVLGMVVLPWLTWAMFYFGSFVPQTFFAKQRLTLPMLYFGTAVIRFANTPWFLFPDVVRPFLARLTPLFWVWGAMFVWYRARQAVPLCAYGIGLLIAYSWIAPPMVHQWHLYLAQLTSTLLFVLGTAGWLAAFGASHAPNARWGGALAFGLVSGVLTTTAIGQTAVLEKTYRTAFWYGKRHDNYVETAEWLRTHIRSGRAVLANEFGTVGYFSGLRMVDPYGLINPTNAFPREERIEHLEELVRWYHPDVVIVMTPLVGALMERRTSYQMVKVFDWDPFSTVLVRDPDVLLEPNTLNRLRASLPARAQFAVEGSTQDRTQLVSTLRGR